MTADEKNYEKVLNVLRNSKPALKDVEAVTEKIMKQLQEEKSKVTLAELIFEYMFGWVYIGWVRRSMVTASLVLAFLFVYQQSLIISRINDLSGQRIRNGTLFMTNLRDDLADKLLIYRITGRKLSDEKISISQKEIDEMINSLNKLQVKYKDVINLIENDPQLKKYVESRMNKNRKTKI
jgi:hypothetical protein